MKDAINPNDIEITGSSPNVLGWPITARVTGVQLTPGEVSFSAVVPNWPHITPEGWTGGIQSTLWIVVKSSGQWRTTGSIEFWGGDNPRTGTGSPLSSGLKDWWYYAQEIGQPQPGDTVGLFIAAGDQRRKDVRSVEERSNIVTFTVPPNDTGSFTFADDAPPVVVPPVVDPPNEDDKPKPPAGHVSLAELKALILDESEKAEAFRQEARRFAKQVAAAFAGRQA